MISTGKQIWWYWLKNGFDGGDWIMDFSVATIISKPSLTENDILWEANIQPMNQNLQQKIKTHNGPIFVKLEIKFL